MANRYMVGGARASPSRGEVILKIVSVVGILFIASYLIFQLFDIPSLWNNFFSRNKVAATVPAAAVVPPMATPTVQPGGLHIDNLVVNDSCHDYRKSATLFLIQGRSYNLEGFLIDKDKNPVPGIKGSLFEWGLQTDGNGKFTLPDIRFDRVGRFSYDFSFPGLIGMGLNFKVDPEPIDAVGSPITTTCDAERALLEDKRLRDLLEKNLGVDLSQPYTVEVGPSKGTTTFGMRSDGSVYNGISTEPGEEVIKVSFPQSGEEVEIRPACRNPQVKPPGVKPAVTPTEKAVVPKQVVTPTPAPHTQVVLEKKRRMLNGSFVPESGVVMNLLNSNCSAVLQSKVSSASGVAVFPLTSAGTFCAQVVFGKQLGNLEMRPIVAGSQSVRDDGTTWFVSEVFNIGAGQSKSIAFLNEGLERRITLVQDTPVPPTITSVPQSTSSPTVPPATVTSSPTAVPSVTPLPVTPTFSFTVVPINTPSNTPGPSPTSQCVECLQPTRVVATMAPPWPTPIWTPLPTHTPRPATMVPTPPTTPTMAPWPVAPSSTPAPAATAGPAFTNTPFIR